MMLMTMSSDTPQGHLSEIHDSSKETAKPFTVGNQADSMYLDEQPTELVYQNLSLRQALRMDHGWDPKLNRMERSDWIIPRESFSTCNSTFKHQYSPSTNIQ